MNKAFAKLTGDEITLASSIFKKEFMKNLKNGNSVLSFCFSTYAEIEILDIDVTKTNTILLYKIYTLGPYLETVISRLLLLLLLLSSLEPDSNGHGNEKQKGRSRKKSRVCVCGGGDVCIESGDKRLLRRILGVVYP